MAAITAALIKQVREETGAGMMDVKKALTEAEGDVARAKEIIRAKGIQAAGKREGRKAQEGTIASTVVESANGQTGYAVELNSETDFVAKNAQFIEFVKDVCYVVGKWGPVDMDTLMTLPYRTTGMTVQQALQDKIMVIGENIKVRRFAFYTEGVSVPYIHAGGKIGVLVNLAVDGGIDATEIGKNVAMQIAALNPRFWDKSQVTDEVLAEEKKIALALMDTDPKMASKPEAVKEKIVMGKMNKFYEENCLLQMEFVRGDIFQGSVEKYIADAAKKLGGSVKFVDAVRFQTGEGIEKKQEDFAAEVAAQMNMGK